jgi:hypothetical protein
MQSVCYLTLITSAHPRSLPLFIYQFLCSCQLQLDATTTLLSHQDPRTRSDKTHFYVNYLKNVFSFWVVLIGTVNAMIGLGIWTSSWHLLGASLGTSTPVPSIS